MKRPRGFTLVELLVVVAVIGVLIAISLPAVMRTRESARATKCANNLRQLGIAISDFTTAHHGEFPQTYHGGDQQSWIYTLAPWIEDVDATRICPNDAQGHKRLENKGTSYVISEYISLPGPDAKLKINYLESTSQTIMVLEGSDLRDPESFYYEHCHPSDWFKQVNIDRGRVWIRLLQEIQPDRHWRGKGGDNTKGTAHYLFADGHVKAMPAQTIHGWALEGFNFALPDRCPNLD